MRYYRHDLDQITAVLDLGALSILSIDPPYPSPLHTHSLSLSPSFSVSLVLSFLPGRQAGKAG